MQEELDLLGGIKRGIEKTLIDRHKYRAREVSIIAKYLDEQKI